MKKLNCILLFSFNLLFIIISLSSYCQENTIIDTGRYVITDSSYRYTSILNGVELINEEVSYEIEDFTSVDSSSSMVEDPIIKPIFKPRVNANELYRTYPDAVFISDSGKKTVDYFTLVPLMFQMIKEQELRITELEKKIL